MSFVLWLILLIDSPHQRVHALFLYPHYYLTLRRWFHTEEISKPTPKKIGKTFIYILVLVLKSWIGIWHIFYIVDISAFSQGRHQLLGSLKFCRDRKARVKHKKPNGVKKWREICTQMHFPTWWQNSLNPWHNLSPPSFCADLLRLLVESVERVWSSW